jgi:hypothetical protein
MRRRAAHRSVGRNHDSGDEAILRQLPLIALAFGLPAFSMTSELAVEPPAPSISQCALIEVHDTAGIGWWSSAALEINPAAAMNNAD